MPRANLKPEIERFWEKVDIGSPDECWNWIAGKNQCGYGTFRSSDNSLAHRFSYLLHKGPIPNNVEVRHTCHNPACVNPNHLILGTHIDNMKDLAISGRRKGFRRKAKYIPKPKPTREQVFLSYINKDGPTMPHMNTPCWMWTRWLNSKGYGKFSVSGIPRLAHRVSYETFNGPIPDGLKVLHKCDNPTCVNPDHLSIGTIADNVQQMILRGRHVSLKGEQHYNAKLTQKQVDEIRYKYAFTNTSQPILAREYGVTQTAIWYVLHHRNWA